MLACMCLKMEPMQFRVRGFISSYLEKVRLSHLNVTTGSASVDPSKRVTPSCMEGSFRIWPTCWRLVPLPPRPDLPIGLPTLKHPHSVLSRFYLKSLCHLPQASINFPCASLAQTGADWCMSFIAVTNFCCTPRFAQVLCTDWRECLDCTLRNISGSFPPHTKILSLTPFYYKF